MPLHLKEIKAVTKTVDVKVLGEVIHVTYRPYAITPAARERYVEKDADDTDVFCDYVVEWDVMGEDGKPIPVNQKSLKNVPILIINDTLTAIQEAQNPPKSGASGSLG